MQELKNELQKAIAKVVKNQRKKSITKSADEIAMGKSMWADLENGIKDPQFSTLWRIAEGLELKPHALVELIEKELGDNFSFLENTTGKQSCKVDTKL
ncbi:MAG: helix-turn-helix transcriptional regulator [bacterium]|nr:helix-turn-helix transcriptional regulator [bacterium]